MFKIILTLSFPVMLSACGWSVVVFKTPEYDLVPRRPGDDGFSIELNFLEDFSAEEKALMQKAVARWEELIVGDLPDLIYREPKHFVTDYTGDEVILRPARRVDDLVVYVTSHELDEFAGMTVLLDTRDAVGGGLPATALLVLDHGLFGRFNYEGGYYSLVLHELGHALGFVPRYLIDQTTFFADSRKGVTWDEGYLYKGSKSKEVFKRMLVRDHGLSPEVEIHGVPLREAKLISGHVPFIGHWRPEIIGDELMIEGWVKPFSTPISELTLAVFEDIGHLVDYSKVDEYHLPPLNHKESTPD